MFLKATLREKTAAWHFFDLHLKVQEAQQKYTAFAKKMGVTNFGMDRRFFLPGTIDGLVMEKKPCGWKDAPGYSKYKKADGSGVFFPKKTKANADILAEIKEMEAGCVPLKSFLSLLNIKETVVTLIDGRDVFITGLTYFYKGPLYVRIPTIKDYQIPEGFIEITETEFMQAYKSRKPQCHAD